MSPHRILARVVAAAVVTLAAPLARAHLTGEAVHDALARMIEEELAKEHGAVMHLAGVAAEPFSLAERGGAPAAAGIFAAAGLAVRVRWDDRFLYVEANGLPAHGMMTGITAWQQQVPLPQPYTGRNAWRIPLHPVAAANPVPIKGRFLRGAIALAANGVPICNPQNNRGETAQEIGELDAWGGHCGSADDYHYHAAPLHLQSLVGPGKPIAYALDGYAIYGLTEPDGTTPAGLDACHGHETAALGYHYHGTTEYPYGNGGFHGEVTEIDGQVDPQPRAQPVRAAQVPLRGARIVGFTGVPGQTPVRLDYVVEGRAASVAYTMAGPGAWTFRFTGVDGTTREETKTAGGGRGGRDGPEDGGAPGRD